MHLLAEDKLILSSVKINPNQSELEKIDHLIPLIQDWDYLITTINNRKQGNEETRKQLLMTAL